MNHEMLQSLLLSSRAPRTSRKGRGEEMPWLVQLLPCYSPPRKRSRFSRPVCPGLRPCRSGSQSGQVPWPRARCPPRAWHRHARGSVPGHGRGSCRVLSLRNCAALCSAGERRQQWKRCPIPGGGGALRESSAGRAGPGRASAIPDPQCREKSRINRSGSSGARPANCVRRGTARSRWDPLLPGRSALLHLGKGES